ncbi:MAG: cell division protein FtsZ, partial [Pseudorhodobacter sp.]|nr:cell division protein FtsZ [Pseudorhodobacter sp.]
MGTGEASGENRAVQAAEKAIANPLLDEISLHGAKGVLINITGGYDLTLFELDEAANIIREKVDPDANIIVGSTLDTGMEGVLRVSVVATGIDANQANRADAPVARRSMAAPLSAGLAAPEPQAEPRREPARAAQAPAAAAPNLFDNIDQSSFPSLDDAAAEQDNLVVDDLPPPAYRPQPTPQARPVASADGQDAAAFIAPRPRAPGTPSPEALARLQAAVSKTPAARAQAQQQSPRAAAPAPEPAPRAADRSRFGIGSLINRMAGHPEPQVQRSAPAARSLPPVTSYDDEPELSADLERIEIPAFLRRQAN